LRKRTVAEATRLRIHTVSIDAVIYTLEGKWGAQEVRFEYRETHPQEVGVFFRNPTTSYVTFWRVHRDVLKQGLYQETYNPEGFFRTRTDIPDNAGDMEFVYLIMLRGVDGQAHISLKDYDAIEEFIDAIYEAVPDEELHPGRGWDNVIRRLEEYANTPQA
jgi:hypothetical protein